MLDDPSDLPSPTSADDPDARRASFIRRQLPFLAILALAIGGVAYTNFSQRPLVGFWEFLAVLMGLLCVITRWPEDEDDDREGRVRLMWTQALHWLAVLVAMNVMLLPGVQQLLPTLGVSLILLMLLALGTFLAGVSLLSLQLCFLGVALVLAVPAIAWLKQSALFLILMGVFVIGVGMAFWSYRSDARPRSATRRSTRRPESIR
ncbi:MAG: hypothetical protein M9932_13775 [Xanthobacteraceae bacterium]|nr:hypothetical protein [Xanthobacteraceae bacterium]